MNEKPFGDQTVLGHLNTELICYSDPNCLLQMASKISKSRRFHFSVNDVCNIPSSSSQSDNSDHEMWVKLMTSENEKSHGSLFLRIGAIAFGLGTLIYAGLEFLTFFEMPKICPEWSILLGVNPVLYMIFVFMQVQIN